MCLCAVGWHSVFVLHTAAAVFHRMHSTHEYIYIYICVSIPSFPQQYSSRHSICYIHILYLFSYKRKLLPLSQLTVSSSLQFFFRRSLFVKYFRYRMYLSCMIVRAAYIRSCNTCNSGSLSSIFHSPFSFISSTHSFALMFVIVMASDNTIALPFICLFTPFHYQFWFCYFGSSSLLLLFYRWSLLIVLCRVCCFLSSKSLHCYYGHC